MKAIAVIGKFTHPIIREPQCFVRRCARGILSTDLAMSVSIRSQEDAPDSFPVRSTRMVICGSSRATQPAFAIAWFLSTATDMRRPPGVDAISQPVSAA